jgi:hypothetical protein
MVYELSAIEDCGSAIMANVAVLFIVGNKFFFKLLLMVGVLRRFFYRPSIAFRDCELCKGGFAVGTMIVTDFSIFGKAPLTYFF